MSAAAITAETFTHAQVRASRRLFGDVAIVVFLIVQGLDGALTYMGVHIWGLAIEANPIVSSAVSLAGVGAGLAAAKLFAIALGIALHLRGVHRAIAVLSGIYIAAAIVPWTLMFMTL
jgi:hypothetical protein